MTPGPWPALPVGDWTDTRDTLHMWLQILGKLRMAAAPPLNHWWHTTLAVTARGLTTGPMAAGDQFVDVELDLVDHRVVARASGGFGRTSAARPGRSTSSGAQWIWPPPGSPAAPRPSTPVALRTVRTR